MQEIIRVTRPGGTVAIMAACRLKFDADWFREWFAPVFAVAQRYEVEVRTPLHEAGEVPALFRAHGLREVEVRDVSSRWIFAEPEAAVHHLVQGVSFFQEVLELVPWAARVALIAELKQRGAAVCARTTTKERTLQMPAQFVRGVVV